MAKSDLSFFEKLRLVPRLILELSLAAPKVVRTNIQFVKKHKRRPSKREAHRMTLAILAKSKFFKDVESSFDDMVGMIIMAWATVEHTVDLINALSVARAGGNKLARFLPQGLKPKLALFKRSFEQLEALAPFKDRALTIHEELNALKEFRHDFAHGIIVRRQFFNARRILRHSYSGSKLLPRYRTYTGTEMLDTFIKMAWLRHNLNQLLSDIDASLPKEMVNDAGG